MTTAFRKAVEAMPHDFDVIDNGSIISIIPRNETAQAWIDDNVQSEGWQWLDQALCIDHRMADTLIDGILCEGFTIGNG